MSDGVTGRVHSTVQQSAAAGTMHGTAYLRLVVIRPVTTQASKGSAVKLTAAKKMVEAARSTAAGFQLQWAG